MNLRPAGPPSLLFYAVLAIAVNVCPSLAKGASAGHYRTSDPYDQLLRGARRRHRSYHLLDDRGLLKQSSREGRRSGRRVCGYVRPSSAPSCAGHTRIARGAWGRQSWLRPQGPATRSSGS